MIKEGYDHFEVTKQEPKVDFCEKKYVFDAMRGTQRDARAGVRSFGQMPGLRHSRRRCRRRTREAAGRGRPDRQTGFAKGTQVARLQHRHRRRYEQGVRRARSRRQYRTFRRRRRPQGESQRSLARTPGGAPSHVNPPRGAPSDNLLLGAPARTQARGSACFHARRLHPLRPASPTPSRPRNTAGSSQSSPARSALAARRMPPQARRRHRTREAESR